MVPDICNGVEPGTSSLHVLMVMENLKIRRIYWLLSSGRPLAKLRYSAQCKVARSTALSHDFHRLLCTPGVYTGIHFILIRMKFSGSLSEILQ